MKSRVFAMWAVCAAAVAAFSAELPRDVKYVAHQGEEALAPNHSIPAYRFAVEHKLDYMKLDVRETKDGVAVIQHDATIKAMTGADLAIKDTPYAELKKYVYRPLGGFTNETIVTLAEALAIAKTLPGIWIDFEYFTPAFAEKVAVHFPVRGKEQNTGSTRGDGIGEGRPVTTGELIAVESAHNGQRLTQGREDAN